MVKATKRGNFKPVVLPEPQTTVARCYSMIDIGTVDIIYQNRVLGKGHRIFITWELPMVKAIFNEEKGEQPFVLSEEFTLSTKDNSNLAKLVAQWRGKPFTAEEEESWDPTVMVGKTALVQFGHKRKKKYADEKIKEVTNENTNLVMQSIMKRPANMDIPKGINPYYVWDWEPIENGTVKFDPEKFDLIPNFLQEKIETSEEFKKYGVQPVAAPAEPSQEGSGDGEAVTKDDW